MIEALAALLLAAQTPTTLEIREQRKVLMEACLGHQEQLFGLLEALDRPENDSASAATAGKIRADCSLTATELKKSEWSAPCGQFLTRHAEVASIMADIFDGRRPRDDVPSFIYPGWQGDAARCYQISQLEGE